jgi:hypothetical protein
MHSLLSPVDVQCGVKHNPLEHQEARFMCVRGNRKGKEDLWLDMMWFVMFSRFSMDYPDCPLSLDGTELSSTVFLSPWRTPRTVLAVFEGLHISFPYPSFPL